jgi:hypothetical protein
LRRLELLSYVEGLVYHSRGSAEHPALHKRIDDALLDEETLLEVDMVRKTMAEVEGERYTLLERKRTLLELLRLRFHSLPVEMEQTIEETQDADRLAEWLRGVVTARDLSALGISPPN